MTLRCYRISLYAFVFAVAVSTAWAQEKEEKCKCPLFGIAAHPDAGVSGTIAIECNRCQEGTCDVDLKAIADRHFWTQWLNSSEKSTITTFITPIFEGGGKGQPIPVTIKLCNPHNGEKSCCTGQTDCCDNGCCTKNSKCSWQSKLLDLDLKFPCPFFGQDCWSKVWQWLPGNDKSITLTFVAPKFEGAPIPVNVKFAIQAGQPCSKTQGQCCQQAACAGKTESCENCCKTAAGTCCQAKACCQANGSCCKDNMSCCNNNTSCGRGNASCSSTKSSCCSNSACRCKDGSCCSQNQACSQSNGSCCASRTTGHGEECCCTDEGTCTSKCCTDNSCSSGCSKTVHASARRVVTRVHKCEDLVDADCTSRGGRHWDASMLVDLVVKHVQPLTWSTMGGTGTIDWYPVGKSLVVTQTPDVQEQVQEFLTSLARTVDNDADEDSAEAEPPAKNWALGMMPYADPGFFMPWAMVGVPRAPLPAAEPIRPPMAAGPGEMPFALPSPNLPAMMPYCAPMPRAVPVMQCSATGTTSQGPWIMRAVNEAGKSMIAVCPSNDELKMCCERLTLKTDNHNMVDFGTRNGQIAVGFNGFDALADCVVRNDDHSVMLQGHVTIGARSGDCSHPCMDEATISWNDGKVHLQCTWPANEPPCVTTPVHRRVQWSTSGSEK